MLFHHGTGAIAWGERGGGAIATLSSLNFILSYEGAVGGHMSTDIKTLQLKYLIQLYQHVCVGCTLYKSADINVFTNSRYHDMLSV